MANLTPMMWYLKKQATLETAIYGAEFLAARTCMEQNVDLRIILIFWSASLQN